MDSTLFAVGFAILFDLLKDTKAMRKAKPALRKLFMTLWANRLQFLTIEDLLSMGVVKKEQE